MRLRRPRCVSKQRQVHALYDIHDHNFLWLFRCLRFVRGTDMCSFRSLDFVRGTRVCNGFRSLDFVRYTRVRNGFRPLCFTRSARVCNGLSGPRWRADFGRLSTVAASRHDECLYARALVSVRLGRRKIFVPQSLYQAAIASQASVHCVSRSSSPLGRAGVLRCCTRFLHSQH